MCPVMLNLLGGECVPALTGLCAAQMLYTADACIFPGTLLQTPCMGRIRCLTGICVQQPQYF